MLRKILLVLLLLGLLLPATTTNAAKDYTAERFDVDLEIQADGALVVTETVVFRFEGGPFTYVFRDLAYAEIDQIDRLQASMDGEVLPQGVGPGQVEVEAGDPLKVTWHLAPTSDATHTFTLVYRVQGAIRQIENADALIWRAVPEEHEYPIASSTITLRYPPTARLLEEPQLRGRDATVETGENQVILTTYEIDEDEDVVVQALFAPGSVIASPPKWQAQAAERSRQVRSALPLGIGALLATLLLGAGVLVWYWRAHTRSQPPRPAGPFRPTEPPSEDPPAFGTALTGAGIPPLATFFHLAQRGVLRIEETPGRWGRNFTLYRQPAADLLRPHEQGLLDAIFRTKDGVSDAISLSKTASRVGSHKKLFDRPLEDELAQAGLLDKERKSQRSRLVAVTVLLLVLGGAACFGAIILGAISADNARWTVLPALAVLAGVAGGLAIVGFCGVIAASTWSVWTLEGEWQATAWKGFAAYLKDVARDKQVLVDTALFDAYLPYAAGFRLGDSWAKRYQKQSGLGVPAWFHGLADSDSSAAFIAVMVATHSSFGSSGAGGASGAAGASGGGASGAG
jgi:hypothetical protein